MSADIQMDEEFFLCQQASPEKKGMYEAAMYFDVNPLTNKSEPRFSGDRRYWDGENWLVAAPGKSGASKLSLFGALRNHAWKPVVKKAPWALSYTPEGKKNMEAYKAAKSAKSA